MRASLTIALAVLAVAACSVDRLPFTLPPTSPRPSVNASTRPSPPPPRTSPPSSPTASAPAVVWTPPDPVEEPAPPSESMPARATVRQDGVELTIEVERNPLPAGEATWARTILRNVGSDDLLYSAGCGPVGVGGEMTEARWRPGLALRGKAADYKTWALEELSLEEGWVRIAFTDEWAVEQGLEAGEYGCADVLIVERLRPGQALVQRARWNGWTVRSYGPPPAGPASLTAAFGFYWRASEGEQDPPGAYERWIEVELDGWIDGLAEPPLVHPAEAIDIALHDLEYGPFLLSRSFRSGVDWYLRYVPAQRAWHVAAGATGQDPALIAVVDAFVGGVRDVIDRR